MELEITPSLLTALSSVMPVEAVSGREHSGDQSRSRKDNDKSSTALNASVESTDKLDALNHNDARLTDCLDSLANMQAMQRTALQFRLDKVSGQDVIRVVDIESGTLIRQLPSAEALALTQKLDEIKGLLIEIQV
ncbi:flagellar protein FlaG [uncultured Shewanella sp.]|uniref:flagellar protein FlaG n=1 Tax=uncultured Shewanella sp. TaxID=173975 RepID=UPI0026223C4D|nr:flagellar protein FlaG [uncultured Shewanella sp.]